MAQNESYAIEKHMRTALRLTMLATVLSAAFPSRGEAQNTALPCALGGVVTDSTGLPVPGAVITVDRSTLEATSDADGRFCIPNPPSGPLALTATLDGFTPQRLETTRRDGTPATLTFRLAPEFSDQVVVTATRTGRRLDDVPIRTELVDREDIDRIGARTLADAMEFTTGVRVESNCQNCNFSQIRLLGLEGPYTQLLIDGQPVISSLAQVYGIEQIPSRMIQRIEIVKGGGSALYGSGSVGGVVNIIPREPSRPAGLFESRVDWSRGVPNLSHSGSADWASADQRANIMAFAQIDHVKPLDLTGDGFTEVSLRKLRAGGARGSRYLLDGRG